MGTIKSPIKWQIASEAGAKLSEQKEERKTDLHVSLDLTIQERKATQPPTLETPLPQLNDKKRKKK